MPCSLITTHSPSQVASREAQIRPDGPDLDPDPRRQSHSRKIPSEKNPDLDLDSDLDPDTQPLHFWSDDPGAQYGDEVEIKFSSRENNDGDGTDMNELDEHADAHADHDDHDGDADAEMGGEVPDDDGASVGWGNFDREANSADDSESSDMDCDNPPVASRGNPKYSDEVSTRS